MPTLTQLGPGVVDRLRPTRDICTTKRALDESPSEIGIRFATSVARAYTLMMRLSRRGFGSSRRERDSKTWLSAALTSGRSGCWKPSPPSSQTAEPGCSNARSEAEHPPSRARSKGSFPSYDGDRGRGRTMLETVRGEMRRVGNAHRVLLLGPLRMRVQQKRHLLLRLLVCSPVQRQPPILRDAGAAVGSLNART